MAGPRDIIRRAAVSKNAPQTPDIRIPAPAPAGTGYAVPQESRNRVSQWRTPPLMTCAAGAPEEAKPDRARDAAVPTAGERVAVAQNIGGHAVYRELMRSHDRMGTRHIPKGE